MELQRAKEEPDRLGQGEDWREKRKGQEQPVGRSRLWRDQETWA